MKDSLKNPLKIGVVLLAIILALVVARAAYFYVYYTLPPRLVNISVSYSPDVTCRMDTPMYVLITNDSYREIINTSFSLSVKKENDNYNYMPLSARDYSTDKIVKAGDSYGGCWTFPKLETNKYVPEKLIYEITSQQIVFRD